MAQREADKRHMSHQGNKHMEGNKRVKHHSGPSQHGVSEREAAPWGHGEFANMPQKTEMQVYPKCPHHGTGVEDDTMVDIDRVNQYAAGQTNKYLSNQK